MSLLHLDEAEKETRPAVPCQLAALVAAASRPLLPRRDLVERLKKRIASGQYRPDPMKVAVAIIEQIGTPQRTEPPEHT